MNSTVLDDVDKDLPSLLNSTQRRERIVFWLGRIHGHLLTIRLSRKWPGLGSQGSHNVRACVVVMIELK